MRPELAELPIPIQRFPTAVATAKVTQGIAPRPEGDPGRRADGRHRSGRAGTPNRDMERSGRGGGARGREGPRRGPARRGGRGPGPRRRQVPLEAEHPGGQGAAGLVPAMLPDRHDFDGAAEEDDRRPGEEDAGRIEAREGQWRRRRGLGAGWPRVEPGNRGLKEGTAGGVEQLPGPVRDRRRRSRSERLVFAQAARPAPPCRASRWR